MLSAVVAVPSLTQACQSSENVTQANALVVAK
jgi:hypothetical protein